MKDEEPGADDLPSDSHLKDDISAASDQPEEAAGDFTPSQTNAGQQVAGLASATNHSEDEVGGSRTDSNNPV
jgi:hypothetical protein